MKNLYVAFRSLFNKGRHNDIKIISLGVGLAMGLVLIAKVCFELSYDNFYPDSERIYAIQENFTLGDKAVEAYPHVSGGVAPGMKAEIPGVEAATRAQTMGEMLMATPDKQKYTGNVIIADECFFDVLPREMLTGNAKETLSRPLYVLVSESLAKKMARGKDAVGMTFELPSFPGHLFTIGGVFKDVPKNTHLFYDVLISLSSYKTVAGWTNKDEWFGGDSYNGYVLLKLGVHAAEMKEPMTQMLNRHVDPAMLKEQGISYSLLLCPLEDLYANSSATKRMAVMLTAIAFAILFATLMNYVLLVISSLVTRSKDIAIHKCYGASGWNISDMIFSETFLNLLLSLLVSALLILGFREMVEELLGASLLSLFTVDTVLLMAAVCLVVFLLAGLLPSQLFAKIPVASVFRSYNESRRSWKKALLFIQFIAVGFLVCLLAIIGWQYHRMVTDDPGYSYDRLAYCKLDGLDRSVRRALYDELSKMPEVAGVATCASLPAFSGSGDIVYRPGTKEAVLHFSDLYGADTNYVPLMEMSVIQGKAFDSSYTDSSNVVMLSRSMADKLAVALDWKDGLVGKTLHIGGHSADFFEVVGVYDDIRIGAIANEQVPPSALFYSSNPQSNLVIKLHAMTADNMKRIDETIKAFLPDKDIPVLSYSVGMTNLYNSSRLFRNSIMLGGIVTFIITLIGLIGYINDETTRRGKEIAVRKINGATEKDVLSLIASDVIYMALPAVLLGAGVSYYAGDKWLQQFAEKIPLNISLFILSSILVLTVILTTVVYRTWLVAISNPVDSLKSE